MTHPSPSADPRPCPTCHGCGQIANDDDSSPWSYWQQLPPGSDLAVRLGLIFPLPCPACSQEPAS